MKVNIHWNMCRVCLTEISTEENSKSIFDIDEDRIEFSTKISECSGIDMKKEANLPEAICKICIKHLDVAFKFRTTCKITNERLQQFLHKANDFLLSEALEMTESLEVPEILDDDNLDNSKIDYEPDTELVEYIVEEDIVEQHQLENEIGTHNDFCESDTLNYVALLKDTISENDITPNIKYTIKSFANKDSDSLETDNILGSFKMEDDRLMLDSDDPITEHHDQFFEIQFNDTVVTKQETVKRKYTKRDINKSFSCDECGNKFKHKYSLDIHMRLHTNEKPFICEICNKDFALNFQLSRHMRIHTGEKPYSCKFCNRKFRDISTRIKHERIHTNERPFKCPHCPKDFIYSDVCKRHIAIHTGEKPYECIPCNKRFAQTYHLKAHLSTLSHKAQSEQSDRELFDTEQNDLNYATFNTPVPTEEHNTDNTEETSSSHN